jgi:mersacidin/lichenicidin family type 2 lantibiotic
MHKVDIVRAWKDPLYRASLSPDELAQLPDNPAGAIELSDDRLKVVSGGAIPNTTARGCTQWTFLNWRSCCTTA